MGRDNIVPTQDTFGQITIDGISMLDVLSFVNKNNGRYIATMLSNLEGVLPADSEEFKAVRKILLDGMNDFTRAILIEIFGNIEGLK
ncbi:hypothetical protein LCGC14_0482870 [marine sediment metagenome]|uniref:Uncharacterized protein n=1 Tax=marine sediment metagenome TaxID=412755 RepID=A0A0F9SE78_9ZZZZ|nr:hypothetical protein [bacterium]